MVLSEVPRKKSSATPPRIDSGTVRLVAQCLNHYATPGPLSMKANFLILPGTSTVKVKVSRNRPEQAQGIPGR